MSCGQTLEDLELILSPMAEMGKESIGSMGDDTPLAVLSDIYRPLSHYFRQNFSQVTNPPIDPLRETRVMGLKTRFRNLRNILAEAGTQTKEMLVLESPVMTTGMYDRFVKLVGKKKAQAQRPSTPIWRKTRSLTASIVASSTCPRMKLSRNIKRRLRAAY